MLLSLVRRQDNERLYIDDSGSKHNETIRSAAPNTSDPCTRRCVSTVVSCPHNEESPDNVHRRAGTWRHASATANVVADAAALADDPKLAFLQVLCH